jgi:hypothetical protein
MKHFFKKTKRKFAIFFAFGASCLILISTILTIFLIRFQMDLRAKNILTKNINELRADYGAAQLNEKAVRFQYDTSTSDESDSSRYKSNSSDSASTDSASSRSETDSQESVNNNKENDENDNQEKEEPENTQGKKPKTDLPNVITQKNLSKDDANAEDIQDIQENRNVYTRVIDPEGYVLYTSDLFDNYNVNFTNDGFQKTETMNTCIYSYTSQIYAGEHKGTTLQTAQFCQITPRQQLHLGFVMVIIAIMASIATYVIGIIISNLLLKPLQRSVDKTREFTQTVYHELLTPISVALSTAESAIKTQKYQKGLKSILVDLKEIRKSLKFLGIKALQKNQILQNDEFQLDKLIAKTLKQVQKRLKRKDIDLDVDLKKKITITSNYKATEIIFHNLIENAFKYTSKNGKIKIILNENVIKIQNTIKRKSTKNICKRLNKTSSDIQNTRKSTTNKNLQSKQIKSTGLGLKITRSLIKDLNWKLTINTFNTKNKLQYLSLNVKFR